MCGIAGIVNFRDNTVQSPDLLRRMLTRIKHRGPDESGIYYNDKVAMGNVRLSIIDIATGQQPLTNADRSLWIVFNGEIFNYIELRQELEGKGYSFKTHSDTEVLVLLYQEYGPKCLEKLIGQFVFAIWDKNKDELFIARDRVGIRPLFYAERQGSLLFGSEIKTLIEYPGLQPEIDPEALSQIFTFWTTITPNTVFKGVYELPPAHYMLINAHGKSVHPYWSLKFPHPENYFKGSVDEAAEELRTIFRDAVRIRLRADVPVAAYLSGGLDSSVTTAFIKEVEPSVLQTFSIGFADKDYDETVFQQEVSKYFDTRHKAFTCSNGDIGFYFPQVVWHTEIPIIRTAPVPMFSLSKLVRENNIKVVITGEGADEILGGYDIFKEAIIREFWNRQPNSKLRPLLIKKLYPYIPQLQNANPATMKFFYGYRMNETNSPYYSHLLRWNNASHIKKYFSKDAGSRLNGYDPYSALTGFVPNDLADLPMLSRAQWLETTIFMSGYLLSSQGDRMGMANSIEGRYPFLDHRVIEFCSSLPPDFKLRGLNEKFLMKHMMKGRLPESVLRRSKQAYRAPIHKSFLGPESPEYVADILQPSNIAKTGIFNPETVDLLVNKLKSSDTATEIESMSLAAIISTELINQMFITGRRPLSESELLSPRMINDKN